MWKRSSQTVKIPSELHETASELAVRKGYSSLDEFVEHLIRTEMDREAGSGEKDEKLKNRLKGLGYL